MDFTPTNPADLEVQAAALVAFNARAAIYQQGTEAVKQAAAAQQYTEAGANLHVLGKAMQETTFDPSHPSGIDVPITPLKIPKPRLRRRGIASQDLNVMETTTRPQTKRIEMSPQDAPDMEVVAPIQVKFMEMLFELAGQLSMRQMMTLSGFLWEFCSSMYDGFERMGCEGVGHYEGTGNGEEVEKDEDSDEKEDESSERECALAEIGENESRSFQATDRDMSDEEGTETWV
jgi:hypothetical protein